jgi:peroxiredoxin
MASSRDLTRLLDVDEQKQIPSITVLRRSARRSIVIGAVAAAIFCGIAIVSGQGDEARTKSPSPGQTTPDTQPATPPSDSPHQASDKANPVAISGTVLDAENRPVANVSVGLATLEKRAFLKEGQFDARQNRAALATTDEQGRFTFPIPADETWFLVAIHETGYAEATRETFEASHQMHLRPWGRVEGEVRLGLLPDVQREIWVLPVSREKRSFFVDSDTSRSTTDDRGRFVVERVIPGSASISRAISYGRNGNTRTSGWNQYVDVWPGEIAKVTIGGTGQPVVGQIVLDRPPDFELDWESNNPVVIERWDVAEDRKDRDAFRALGAIDPTGHFTIPDVPPGAYRLTASLTSPQRLTPMDTAGQATRQFVVQQSPGGRSDEPLDLGVITVTLPRTLDVGEFAPDFLAAKLPEGRFRLNDLHGRVVVLCFWGVWRQQSLAQMPVLAELNREFGDDDRFAVVGISCDREIETARKHVADQGYPWINGHVGGVRSRAMQNYTVSTLPATFLIGPDGRILAKDLHRDDWKASVAAALKNDDLFRDAAKVERPPRFPIKRFTPAEADRLPERPAVVVLDNCDPSLDKGVNHTDGLRLVARDGRELRVLKEFNTSQTIGGAHRLAVDGQRGRMILSEAGDGRVTAFDQDGRRLWQVENIDASCLAVDPKSGHIWCSGGTDLTQGETVVLDENGREVDASPYRGIDIAYDPHTDAFWLTGYRIIKLNRKGDVLFERPVDGWCCPSVSTNPKDGTVWFIERQHIDNPKSHNRLWKLDAAGRTLIDRDLGGQYVFAVECDPITGDAWVATLLGGLLHFSPEGEPAGVVDQRCHHLAVSQAGLWLTTVDALLRLDASGAPVVRYAFDRPSQQSCVAVFGDQE